MVLKTLQVRILLIKKFKKGEKSFETLQSSEEEEEKSSWSSSSGEGSDITVMLGPSMEAAVRCRVLRSGGVRGDSVCCCCIAAPR